MTRIKVDENRRYEVVAGGIVRTMLAPSATIAATRARDQVASWRGFLGRHEGQCEAVATAVDDPTDTATVRFGR